MRPSRTPRHPSSVRHLVGLAAALLVVTAVAVPTSAQADSLGLNKAPTARITAPAGQVYAGDTLTYSGAASSDPDGQVAAYAWTASGVGSVQGTAGAQTASITFSRPGTATISLTVTDNGLLNGALNPLLDPLVGRQFAEKGSTSITVNVVARPNRAPVVTSFGGPNSAPTAYFVGNNLGFTDPDGDDVDIVRVDCTNCRGPDTIVNNATNAGTTKEQREGFTMNTPCYPTNIGLLVTIDDKHGHQVTAYRTIVIYTGGQRGPCT